MIYPEVLRWQKVQLEKGCGHVGSEHVNRYVCDGEDIRV